MLPVEAGISQATSQWHRLPLGFRIASTNLSRGRLFRFLGALRGFEGIPVTARDRSNAASDFLIRFVGQIGQGHTQRPVWRLKTAAVQKHDTVILGQTEGEVERVNVFL